MLSAVSAVSHVSNKRAATYTASPFARTFDTSGANGKIDFSTLAVGEYTYKVDIETLNGSTPTTTNILTQAFKIIGKLLPGAKELFEEAVTSTQFDQKYNVSFTYTRADGTALAAGDNLGTGTVAKYESYTSVIVVVSDLDGDGEYTATDLVMLKAHFKASIHLKAFISKQPMQQKTAH